MEPIIANQAVFDDDIFFAQNNAKDIAPVHAKGFEVDNKNEPAPENIPQGNMPLVTDAAGLYKGQRWGCNGMDSHVNERGNYNGPSFKENWTPTGKLYMNVFFPITWLTNVLLVRTNDVVINAASKPITYGELLLNKSEFWALISTLVLSFLFSLRLSTSVSVSSILHLQLVCPSLQV